MVLFHCQQMYKARERGAGSFRCTRWNQKIPRRVKHNLTSKSHQTHLRHTDDPNFFGVKVWKRRLLELGTPQHIKAIHHVFVEVGFLHQHYHFSLCNLCERNQEVRLAKVFSGFSSHFHKSMLLKVQPFLSIQIAKRILPLRSNQNLENVFRNVGTPPPKKRKEKI